MKRNLLRTMLLAAAFTAGANSALAGVWSTIFSEDYENADTYNQYWTSELTGRYTINQTSRTDSEGGYVMEVAPVGNGDNGTTATYTGLTSIGETYTNASIFRVSFEFNFCYNISRTPSFKIYDTDETEVVGFYSTSTSDGTISIRLGAAGSSTGGTELGGYTTSYKTTTPTTYNQVVIYTKEDGSAGTYMDVTLAGKTTATTYTLDESSAVHIGKLVYNTQKYYNHFVFDNLKVETYADQETVAVPTPKISAIDGTKRTVSITAQDATHTLYYYLGDTESNPMEYTEPFTVEESTTLHCYAQSESGTNSETVDLTINCVAVTLSAPTFMRTGANSYRITAAQEATDGLTPVPTIHYTVGGGEEQTLESGSVASNVDGDIVAWAEADGYTQSETSSMEYVAAIAGTDVWTYNLNSFPSTYSITAIADAIDETTAATLNELTVYNLKNIEKEDLYVDNSSAWLLRTQSASAFKSQSGKGNIVINNVTPSNLIYVKASTDGSKYSISSVTNGEVKYNYDYSEYFIVPTADGAVTITFNAGTAINDITVRLTSITKTLTSTGYASFSSTNSVSVPSDVTVYTAKVKDDNSAVVLTAISDGTNATVVPANTGVILKGEASATVTMAVTTETNTIEDNELIATSSNTTIPSDGTCYGLMAGEAKFAVITGGITVSADKAYLQVSGSGAKTLSIVLDGETTGISEVKAANAKSGAYYNLSGQRVSQPTKGLYIVNGKKVIVK